MQPLIMHQLKLLRRAAWYRVAFYCSLLALLTYVLPAHAAQGDFTIIALPDTQFYSRDNSPIFSAQTQWIVNNKSLRNIVYVAQLGDCVNDADFMSQWQVADSAMSLLENPTMTGLIYGLPYGIAVGNHDQTPWGDPTGNSTQLYNTFFGESRFAGRAYYGGHFGSNNDNHFSLFSASGMDFIVIYLEFDESANSSVLAWADGLLKTYSNRRAIVVSHYLIDPGNPAPFGSQGQATYDALKNNPNLFLMLAGHMQEEGRRTDIFNGNTVHTVLANYQGRENGGNGWLRILEFSPANNQIRVRTYSPWLNQFETDADSEFTLSYNMTTPPPVGGAFTAYNDLAWAGGQLTSNITRITSPNGGSGLPSSGQLIDFATGGGTGVTLTVSGGTFDGAGHATQFSGAPAPGTDAFNVFDGKLTAFGSLSYEDAAPPAGNLVLTFSGLNPNKLYELVYYAHRDDYGWTRASLVTLFGAAGYTNQSSVATNNPADPNGAIFSGPGDDSTRLPADNDNGYVARFMNIAPGSDGQVALSVSWDGAAGAEYRGKYGNALMLREQGGTPTNQPPGVNAGADQTITLPSSANLAGTVSDDGLPNPPGAVTVTWSRVSGPGTVTFGNANAVSTTASFSVAGSYVLRLTANDGSLQASDDISVTVNPAGPSNQFPSVNAGADQTITLPSSANLAGAVSDDGLPNPPGAVTVTWSRVSGPGTVTFGNANAVNTTASFSVAGSYVLRLTANDGSLQASDDVIITVNSAGATNQFPSVNAGPDQTITLPSSATLAGAVSDDGLPNPPGAVTVTWSRVSGPGTVTFGNANAVSTTASFSVAGSYVLRLTASDGALQASDDISVTVNVAGAFTAYNDLAWAGGQLTGNITRITSPNGGSGLPSSGQLIDFATGSGTGVSLTVSGGTFDGAGHATQFSGSPAPGTEAYNVFNGKLTAFGSLSYEEVAPPAGNLVLTFGGLNPNKLYELVYYAHRDNYNWTRASLVTLVGAAAFANQSSVATDNPAEPSGAIFSGPGDDSTRLPADNDNGYVARFVNIAPGSDGQVALSVSWDGAPGSEYKGKYGNALMLREQSGN